MVVPKKRFRTKYVFILLVNWLGKFLFYLILYNFSGNDNKCETVVEPKRLSSPISSEASSSRLSSPESSTSNTSTHVHYKKRVSRTFAESQSNTS